MESSFQVSICECPDINANTMAVDGTGRYALISGRKSMVLVDLDGGDANVTTSGKVSLSTNDDETIGASVVVHNPSKSSPVSKRMARNTKYEPTACHFNRHLTDLFALTTYQVVEVLSLDDLNPLKPKLILKGHSRAIADVEWSHFDPYLLGSSSADCLTNLWDIRDNRRPSATLTSVSSANLVRFSKTSSNLIATSHDIDVRIWDIRKPNLPLNYIAAHLQKINGMDWNPNKTSCDQEQLITCSQDNTIKLWDLNVNKIKPTANLQTRTPAWRIRYTPVSSNAILTSTLPQLRSRSECLALKLWSMKPNRYEQKKLELILGLVGHSDVIVDFDWRARPSSTGCEIVSWSKDQTLRVWRIDQQFIEMNVDNSDFEADCETHDTTCQSTEGGSFTSKAHQEQDTSATKSSISSKQNISANTIDSPASQEQSTRLLRQTEEGRTGVESESSDQDDISNENSSSLNELKQEFNLINKNIPNIEFEELNSLRRVCLVTARAKSVTCRLRIALPPSYPHNEGPTFTIIDSNQIGGETLSKEAKEKLLHLLNETAKAQLGRSRNCLEPCLRKFIAALQKITSHSAYRKRPAGSVGQDYKDDPITLSAQRDHSVPFPSTSGARFCGNLLVCFGRPIIPSLSTSTPSGAETTNWSVETPRSMAQLSAQLDNMRRQGSYNLSNISISYFYYGAMRRAEMQQRQQGIASKVSSSGGGGGSTGTRISSNKYIPGRAGSKSSALHNQNIMSKNYKCGPVLIYNVSDILGGICKDLAENYVFDKDVIKMCQRNAKIAALYNRRDLVQIWSLAELSSEGVLHSYIPFKEVDHPFSSVNPDSDFGDRPWTMHPFGSKLIQSLIDHYVYNCHDVQTAAMLVWTFSSPKLDRNNQQQQQQQQKSNTNNRLKNISSSSSNPVNNKNNPLYNLNNSLNSYYTVMPGMLTGCSNSKQSNIDTISDEWNFVNGPETHLYSNSWSNSTIHEHLAETHQSSGGVGANERQVLKTALNNATDNNSCNSNKQISGVVEDRFPPKLNILSPERSLQNDLIMHIYAEVLYRLNLLNQRAMVLKNIGSNSPYSEIFGNRQTLNDVIEERVPNLTIQCHNGNCRNKCHSVQCPQCRKYSLYCSICRLPVRGSCSICLKCLHGGHVNHFSTWFSSYDFCPTGCGCKCLISEE